MDEEDLVPDRNAPGEPVGVQRHGTGPGQEQGGHPAPRGHGDGRPGGEPQQHDPFRRPRERHPLKVQGEGDGDRQERPPDPLVNQDRHRVVGHPSGVVGGDDAVEHGQPQRPGALERRTEGLESHVDGPEVARRIGHDQHQVERLGPAPRRPLPEEGGEEEDQEERREQEQPRERPGRLEIGAECREQEQRATAPRHLGEHRPRPEPGHEQDQDVEDQEVDEEVPLVGVLDVQQHRGQQATEDREHRGAEPAGQDRHQGSEQRDREHRGERDRRADQAVERLGREQRQVEPAEPAAGEPLAQVG